MKHFLPSDDFLHVLKCTPLVSIDQIIFDIQGRVLLGKRRNEPAKDFWFVPGGRIGRLERLHEAFARIAGTELGLELKIEDGKLKGVYEHLYETNALLEPNVETHYVVLAYEIFLKEDIAVKLDPQHSELSWFGVEEILKNDAVHENTKAYFQ